MICVSLDENKADAVHLTWLWVHSTHRKLGLANALCRQSIAWAKSHGAMSVYLAVNPSNTSAIRLHESLGFQPNARQPTFQSMMLLI